MTHFLDADALVSRIVHSASGKGRPIVFLLGSGLTTPRIHDGRGVPGADGVCKLLEKRLGAALPSGCSYQRAFEVLIDAQGLDAANEVIQEAVLGARKGARPSGVADMASLEADIDGWEVHPGLHAIACLAAHFPTRIGRTILTTNFDPLIEVALAREKVPWYSTALHADGSLLYLRGTGTNVVHLHGYWWGSGTLHTSSQLTAKRPLLLASLRRLLRDCTLVVVGYGGWTDAFMEALASAARENDVHEILWAFRSDDPESIGHAYGDVLQLLGKLQTQHQCRFFRGVDADKAIAKALATALEAIPAESRGVFLQRATLMRSGSVFLPSGVTLAGADSPGEMVKALRHFGDEGPAQAALYISEYLLPYLEQQPIHQAPTAQQFAEVRPVVRAALQLIGHPDVALEAQVRRGLDNVERALESIDSAGRSYTFDAFALRVIGDALCSALVLASQTPTSWRFGPQWPDSSADWAAASVHAAKRALYDNELMLWTYISARLRRKGTED